MIGIPRMMDSEHSAVIDVIPVYALPFCWVSHVLIRRLQLSARGERPICCCIFEDSQFIERASTRSMHACLLIVFLFTILNSLLFTCRSSSSHDSVISLEHVSAPLCPYTIVQKIRNKGLSGKFETS